MMRRRDYSEEGRPIDPGGSGPSEIGPGGVNRAEAFGGPRAGQGGVDVRLAGILDELGQLAEALSNLAGAQEALDQAVVRINWVRYAARQSGWG
jgi:hypothetical protein